MATLDDIKAQIKSIAESVTGIGIVYTQSPNIILWDKLKEKFVKNDRINVLLIEHKTRQSETDESNHEVSKVRKWQFRLIYGYSFDDNSEKDFDNLIDALCDKFNADADLNKKVHDHSLLEMTQPKNIVMVTDVLCHDAILELITYDP